MTQLFIRFYQALGLVVALMVGVYVALDALPSDTQLPARMQVVASASAITAARLARTTSPEARDAEAAAIAAELKVPVEVAPLAQVQASLRGLERDRLERGEPVASALAPGVAALYVRVPDQPFVAVLRLEETSPRYLRIPLLSGLLVLGLGGAVFATLLPLQRQLVALSEAARRLGQGELEARAVVSTQDEAGKLAQTFNDMADRVARLVQAREELLLAVSHELRTPVARVRVAVDLLSEVEDPWEREAQASAIQKDLEELNDLIAELLEYASLVDGRRTPQKEPVELCGFLVERVAEARRLSLEGQVELSTPEELEVEADPRLLRRLITNLLSNAVRYGRGVVQVRAWRGEGRVWVTVEDNGMGIPVADRERVFDPLVRLDSARSRDTGGVGLGLALARRIARAHGGELTAEAGGLGGALFRLWLPEEARRGEK